MVRQSGEQELRGASGTAPERGTLSLPLPLSEPYLPDPPSGAPQHPVSTRAFWASRAVSLCLAFPGGVRRHFRMFEVAQKGSAVRDNAALGGPDPIPKDPRVVDRLLVNEDRLR